MEQKMIRILLADDNSALRSALVLLLETRLNARVIGEANSMEDLLVKAAVKRPDIIILDWELPGTPKAGRIAALRDVHPFVKVIITSSKPEAAQQALAARADAYISKSEPPEKMMHVLQAI